MNSKEILDLLQGDDAPYITHIRTNTTYFVEGLMLVKIDGYWMSHVEYILNGESYARRPDDFEGFEL